MQEDLKAQKNAGLRAQKYAGRFEGQVGIRA